VKYIGALREWIFDSRYRAEIPVPDAIHFHSHSCQIFRHIYFIVWKFPYPIICNSNSDSNYTRHAQAAHYTALTLNTQYGALDNTVHCTVLRLGHVAATQCKGMQE